MVWKITPPPFFFLSFSWAASSYFFQASYKLGVVFLIYIYIRTHGYIIIRNLSDSSFYKKRKKKKTKKERERAHGEFNFKSPRVDRWVRFYTKKKPKPPSAFIQKSASVDENSGNIRSPCLSLFFKDFILTCFIRANIRSLWEWWTPMSVFVRFLFHLNTGCARANLNISPSLLRTTNSSTYKVCPSCSSGTTKKIEPFLPLARKWEEWNTLRYTFFFSIGKSLPVLFRLAFKLSTTKK